MVLRCILLAGKTDLSLVVGAQHGQSSAGGTGWVVAVAVAIPVALAIVVLIIVAALVAAYIRARMNRKEGSMVNFDHVDGSPTLPAADDDEL